MNNNELCIWMNIERKRIIVLEKYKNYGHYISPELLITTIIVVITGIVAVFVF